MNVSYRWLRDLLPGLEADPEAVAEYLALRGAPVDGLQSPGKELGDIVVARVLTAGPHPNADRLKLCTVDGGDGVRQVVCGAPNVEAGALYPFAPVGAVLPGDFKIKKAKIRGEESQGMLCSARELGLGQDHDGILKLDGDFDPGQRFVEAVGLDDTVLDVEITANRGDLLSHVGVARELTALAGGEVRLPELPDAPAVDPEYEVGKGRVEAAGVTIQVDAAELCPRYLGAVIRGVRVGPSPAWLQERLRGAGARPISNVVDATNHVMLELGQPLHAFDLGRLAGKTIVVRTARADEASFTTLDGEDRTVGEDTLMICDAERPVAVAGVMGGLDSEVDADTVDVLLECALFDPKSVRATRRALNMSTDASYRFERGVDPEGQRRALERAVALVLATAGGTLDGPVLDVGGPPAEAPRLDLRLARIHHVLGLRFEASRVAELLEPMGFGVERSDDQTLEVRVPGFRRHDVTREIDLIEELARAHGFDAFPAELGAYRPTTVRDHPLFALEDRLRDRAVGLGLLESHTPAFVAPGEGDVEVLNPLNTREPFLRRAVLPSVARRVAHNLARGVRDVRLFELGTSFRRVGDGERPVEESHLAVALTGRRRPPHWSAPDQEVDVWDLKGMVETFTDAIWGGAVRVVAAEADGSPDRWGDVLGPDARLSVVDGQGVEVGRGGRLRDDVVDPPAWAGPVWGFELALPSGGAEGDDPVHQPLPQHPGVERDLALLIPDAVAVGRVTEAAAETAGDLLESLEVFDVYEGDGIPRGTRSVALRLRFRAPDRTLKDKEVDRIVGKVLTRLTEDTGVQHRG